MTTTRPPFATPDSDPPARDRVSPNCYYQWRRFFFAAVSQVTPKADAGKEVERANQGE